MPDEDQKQDVKQANQRGAARLAAVQALYQMELSGTGVLEIVSESLPIGNAILTVENDEQAWRRAKRSELDKGGFAARAALTMIALKKKLGA